MEFTKNKVLKKIACLFMLMSFLGNMVLPGTATAALSTTFFSAPVLQLPTLRYLSINPANPHNYFNFLLDVGQDTDNGTRNTHNAQRTTKLNQEAKKLINYFFLGLTLKEESFWVNLKPTEADRLTSTTLAKTDMGKVLLEQDLLLKKETSLLLHPNHPQGKLFWQALYQQIGKEKAKKLKITTSNRVWILPDQTKLLETEDGALITKATMKVLLESEYFDIREASCVKREAQTKYASRDTLHASRDTQYASRNTNTEIQNISEQLMKQFILPALQEEVNSSAKFAPLRQIYYSLILAQYYRQKYPVKTNSSLQEPTFNKTAPYHKFINQDYTKNLESKFPWSKDALYQEYLKSYQSGEYNVQAKLEGLKRMYVSGGISGLPKITTSPLDTAPPQRNLPRIAAITNTNGNSAVGIQVLQSSKSSSSDINTGKTDSPILVREIAEFKKGKITENPSDRVANEVKSELDSGGAAIIMPLSALPSYIGKKKNQQNYGIGNFGPAAQEFVNFLERAKIKFWSMLPLSSTNDGGCPYAGLSTAIIEKMYISPEILIKEGWITKKELDTIFPKYAQYFSQDKVNYPKVKEFTDELLDIAYKRFSPEHKSRSDYEDYLKNIGPKFDLDETALFFAIKHKDPRAWADWDIGLRDMEENAIEKFMKENPDSKTFIEKFKLKQYLLFKQQQALKKFANEHNVKLAGDMPYNPQWDSADVWIYHKQGVFLLDENGRMLFVMGCPGDDFDPKGQNWGTVAYNHKNLPSVAKYQAKRLERAYILYDIVRMDHFIGTEHPFIIPVGAQNINQEGMRVSGVADMLFTELLKTEPELARKIWPEDLGAPESKTIEILEKYGLMGMNPLQFIPLDNIKTALEHRYALGSYSDNNIVFSGGHDNNTNKGWYTQDLTPEEQVVLNAFIKKMWQRMSQRDQIAVNNFLAKRGMTGNLTEKSVSTQMMLLTTMSNAKVTAYTLQDIVRDKDGTVGLDAKSRTNHPGTWEGASDEEHRRENWVWRVYPNALTQDVEKDLLELNEISHRTPEQAISRLNAVNLESPEAKLAINILESNNDTSAIDLKLQEMISKGLVRYIGLKKGIIAATYNQDGQEYLLISDSVEAREAGYLSIKEKAASLMEGAKTLAQQSGLFIENEPQIYTKEINEMLDEKLKRIYLILGKAPLALQEEMIELLGALFCPDSAEKEFDPIIVSRLKKLGLWHRERYGYLKRLGHTWTEIFKYAENGGRSREEVLKIILGNNLPEPFKGKLDELLDFLPRAFASELNLDYETIFKTSSPTTQHNSKKVTVTEKRDSHFFTIPDDLGGINLDPIKMSIEHGRRLPFDEKIKSAAELQSLYAVYASSALKWDGLTALYWYQVFNMIKDGISAELSSAARNRLIMTGKDLREKGYLTDPQSLSFLNQLKLNTPLEQMKLTN